MYSNYAIIAIYNEEKGVRAMQAAQLTAIRAQLEEIFGTKIDSLWR
jgi:hypothetical protein